MEYKLNIFSVEADWVQGEYDIFIGNYPSGKATKAQVMERLLNAAKERFPNADANNVAQEILKLHKKKVECILSNVFFKSK